MTIDELEKLCNESRMNGLNGDSEVKVYHPGAKSMGDIISPLIDSQVRRVQCYESDGREYRNKYLMLSVEEKLKRKITEIGAGK